MNKTIKKVLNKFLLHLCLIDNSKIPEKQCFEIRSRSDKKKTSGKENQADMQCFEELNVHSGWLEASPEAWKSFIGVKK